MQRRSNHIINYLRKVTSDNINAIEFYSLITSHMTMLCGKDHVWQLASAVAAMMVTAISLMETAFVTIFAIFVMTAVLISLKPTVL